MINTNNILYLFDNLVRQKYPKSDHTEPSSQDHELANQLFLLFDQLLNSAELQVDNIVTLDFDAYCDDDEENNDGTSYNIDGIKYSYETMCAIVEYSKTHTFSSLHHWYKKIKYKEQLRRIKQYVKAQGSKFNKF